MNIVQHISQTSLAREFEKFSIEHRLSWKVHAVTTILALSLLLATLILTTILLSIWLTPESVTAVIGLVYNVFVFPVLVAGFIIRGTHTRIWARSTWLSYGAALLRTMPVVVIGVEILLLTLLWHRSNADHVTALFQSAHLEPLYWVDSLLLFAIMSAGLLARVKTWRIAIAATVLLAFAWRFDQYESVAAAFMIGVAAILAFGRRSRDATPSDGSAGQVEVF